MKFLPPLFLFVATLAAVPALATEYHVSTAGNDAAPGTAAATFRTIHKASMTVKAGDTVYIHTGTYSETVSLTTSGTASSWITFSAFPGDLPILDGGGGGGVGFGSTTAQYIRVVGIVSRNWGSSGFGNGWVNDVGTSNGNWQFVDCIAEGNAINGITFYNASGLLIDESIVAHNGNGSTSWSSGVNLFHVSGDYTTNIIRRTVAFENLDISSHHSDGSGFILDQNSSGALFENNIGFHNGGSCIRINCPGAHVINNTCWHNGLEPRDAMGLPAKPGEIYFTSGLQGAVVANNLCAASGYGNDQTAVNLALPTNNYAVNSNAVTPFFTNPAGVDFRLAVAGVATVIDKGTATNSPATDIGFDPKCIKMQTGAVSWWQYAFDYTYIASVGGVAGCFHPAKRPSGAAPDIGAYEYGGVVPPGTGGATGSGGAAGTGGRAGGGGMNGTGGGTSTSGTGGLGVSSGGSGVDAIGGRGAATGGSTSTSASGGKVGISTGGTFASGGGPGSIPATDAGAAGASGELGAGAAASAGCACTAAPVEDFPLGIALGTMLGAIGIGRTHRRRRFRASQHGRRATPRR